MVLKKILAAFLPDQKPEHAVQGTDSDPTYQERAAEQRRRLSEALRQHAPAFRAFKIQVEREALHQRWGYTDVFKRIVGEQPILKDTPGARIGMVIALTYWFTEKTESLDNVKVIDDWQHRQAAQHLATRLLGHKLPYAAADLTLVLNLLARQTDYRHNTYLHYYPIATMLGRVEDLVEKSGLTPDMERALDRFKRLITGKNDDNRRIRHRISTLVGDTVLTSLEAGVSWVKHIRDDILSMSDPQRLAWEALIEHSLPPRSSKPSQKWLDKAREIVDGIGKDAFKTKLIHWIRQIQPGDRTSMPVNAEDMLRGMIWACILVDDTELAHVIGDLTLMCFERIRGQGPRSQKMGSACLYTLSWMASDDAVGELCRIRPRLKTAALRRKITAAINETARRRDLSITDLEEIAVPDFSLDSGMVYPDQPGGYRAQFAYRPGGRIRVDWYAPGGRRLKSTPAPVRREHAETLKGIRQIQKTANALFSTQRSRVERLFIQERVWSLKTWCARYLDHPFVGLLSRLLVWHFELGEQRADAIHLGGQMVDLHGHPLEWLTDETQVSLWHPLDHEAETVLAWRTFLEEHRVTQPFKQAHREIYVLTDAEVTTDIYSNRFAAHILRQVPFIGLVRRQGWKYSSSFGHWNNYRTPTLELPHVNLNVEYWVDPIHDPQFGDGIDKCISTDQMRFIGEDGQPLPLTQVPPRVFSEAMRDVDLFVGITSIGADPRWQDQGERPAVMQNYWQGYSFGDLSTSAQSRREVLERLLPRLKIADRSHLTDKFLVVKGHLRTYKIHLGSGNILMEPNDQYLCIVPGRSNPTPGLFLPFEGDQTLSVVLSKAFLLADDRQIKDPTITSQIKRSR